MAEIDGKWEVFVAHLYYDTDGVGRYVYLT